MTGARPYGEATVVPYEQAGVLFGWGKVEMDYGEMGLGVVTYRGWVTLAPTFVTIQQGEALAPSGRWQEIKPVTLPLSDLRCVQWHGTREEMRHGTREER